MEKKQPPVCRDCGDRHWRYLPCAARDARKKKEAERNPPLMDAPGVQRFADRSSSYLVQGNALWLRDPHPRPSGVRTPPDWNLNDEPPEAA